MTLFKCKICGGSLQIENQSVTVCEYCGTKQSLPRLDDERKANLYDRANHFRRNNNFDKAMGIYEAILNEDNTDAEAYWSIVLCRYGIEYVEDPTNHKRVPTVNRAQFTSIYDDEDYKSAIHYADSSQRQIYEDEASIINEIQKRFLDISQMEEPFDVFICYKETDASGKRTPDSVIATELYHELIREGFKVFFSKITLEDKLGIAYEPYIFAALHSARVMIVLGTRPEHFNAVWVKNEWSRYLALIKGGAKKTLIPAYKDMDPYDMPEEFSHLQAQDISRLGFMQDLIRGVRKLLDDGTEAKQEAKNTNNVSFGSIEPLLKRIHMFLEDEEFERADELCELVLNQDPENAEAYVCKLLADLHIKNQNELINCNDVFYDNKNYQKALRFASPSLSDELKGYNEAIKKRNEEKRKEALYEKALYLYHSSKINELNAAIEAFSSLGDYKESHTYINMCEGKIEEIKIKEENERIEKERIAEENRVKAEKMWAERKRIAKKYAFIAVVSSLCVIAIIVGVILISSFVTRNKRYNEALNYIDEGNYELACSVLKELGSFKDSEELLEENQALVLPYIDRLVSNGKYSEVYEKLKLIGFDERSDVYAGYRLIALGNWSAGIQKLKLEHFIVPNSYTEIKECAFQYCDTLKSVTFPNELISIGASAFLGCTSLEEIVIPEGVTYIGSRAFAHCESLKSVSFPNTLLTIDSYAFSNCSSLTEISVPDSVTRVGVTAFAYNTSLRSLRLGSGVTSVGAGIAIGCTKLKTVIVGNDVREIGSSAFEDCISLEEIRLPSALKSIGTAAFRDCTSLKAIKIPANVRLISAEAFSGCSGLKEITFASTQGWQVDGLKYDVSSPTNNAMLFTVTLVSYTWNNK